MECLVITSFDPPCFLFDALLPCPCYSPLGLQRRLSVPLWSLLRYNNFFIANPKPVVFVFPCCARLCIRLSSDAWLRRRTVSFSLGHVGNYESGCWCHFGGVFCHDDDDDDNDAAADAAVVVDDDGGDDDDDHFSNYLLVA